LPNHGFLSQSSQVDATGEALSSFLRCVNACAGGNERGGQVGDRGGSGRGKRRP
jgi:hypothetical protein